LEFEFVDVLIAGRVLTAKLYASNPNPTTGEKSVAFKGFLSYCLNLQGLSPPHVIMANHYGHIVGFEPTNRPLISTPTRDFVEKCELTATINSA
jgi:hypothetical protein